MHAQNASEMLKLDTYLSIQERADIPHQYNGNRNILSDKNAISKHKRNFFSTSNTPLETETDFFDRNFAGFDKTRVLRVRKKYVEGAKMRSSQNK